MSAVHHRRMGVIFVNAAAVAILSLLTPADARSGEEAPCLEPWIKRCVATTAHCANCDTWCNVTSPPTTAALTSRSVRPMRSTVLRRVRSRSTRNAPAKPEPEAMVTETETAMHAADNPATDNSRRREG
jgi:hypothetical protein